MIWVAATMVAALAQTGRNAAQAALGPRIGTLGATAIRFLFGLPFAMALAVIAAQITDLPRPDAATLGFTALGAMAQIAATAFMLLTMRGQGFGVATALTKIEPVTLAIVGAVVLAEPLGPARLAAIGLATLGVLLASGANWSRASLRPVATGIVAGALFGLSAIGFRGAVLALPEAGYLLRALVVLVVSLAMQSAALLLWLAVSDRRILAAILREWRGSLLAGGLGATASLFWFAAFALTPASNVRTLALVEVVFAQILSGRLFRQRTGIGQLAGMALILTGVGWLLAVAAA